jgi:hypothetical protein
MHRRCHWWHAVPRSTPPRHHLLTVLLLLHHALCTHVANSHAFATSPQHSPRCSPIAINRRVGVKIRIKASVSPIGEMSHRDSPLFPRHRSSRSPCVSRMSRDWREKGTWRAERLRAASFSLSIKEWQRIEQPDCSNLPH